MATLYVSEYRQLASVPSATNFAPQAAQGPQEPPLAEYTINISGSSTPGQLLNKYTSLVRIHTDAICSIAIGPAAVATTSMKRLAAPVSKPREQKLGLSLMKLGGMLSMVVLMVLIK